MTKSNAPAKILVLTVVSVAILLVADAVAVATASLWNVAKPGNILDLSFAQGQIHFAYLRFDAGNLIAKSVDRQRVLSHIVFAPFDIGNVHRISGVLMDGVSISPNTQFATRGLSYAYLVCMSLPVAISLAVIPLLLGLLSLSKLRNLQCR